MTNEELLHFIKDRSDNFSIQLKRHHRELFDAIDQRYNFSKFGEKLYHHIYGDEVGKCEVCGQPCQFDGFHKGYRKRCSYKCMNGLKKVPPIEKTCPICNRVFQTDKRHNRTTCSEKCQQAYMQRSDVRQKTYQSTQRALFKKYGVDHPSKMHTHIASVKSSKLKKYGNPNYVNPEKAKQTKLAKYGDADYNNGEQTKKTCLKKYGTTCVFHSPYCPKAAGRRISKFQRSVYDTILKKHADALLEEYLVDAQKSVDIYIPSQRKIIECFGDYWHMNPTKYDPTFYNKSMKLTAQEIWDRDAQRLDHLRSYGYTVEVIWESDWKHSAGPYL